MHTLSITDANTLLEGHGFTDRFSEGQLSELLQRHTAKRIRDAIQRSAHDTGAKRFVENLLTHGRKPSDEPAPDNACDHDTAPTQPEDATERKIPLTFKVYGGKGALEFRAHLSAKNVPTVMLEGALAKGQRRYDWANKLSVQVMPRELPAVAAVLAGMLDKCEFNNHGPDKNKGYSLARQAGGFFVRVFQSGEQHRLIAVPMPPEEAYFVNSLVLRQLARITPDCDGVLVLAAIRAYARAVETH